MSNGNLTKLQHNIVSLCSKNLNNCAYNIPFVIHVSGESNQQKINITLKNVLNRFTSLKTMITAVNGSYHLEECENYEIFQKESNDQDIYSSLMYEASINLTKVNHQLSRIIVWTTPSMGTFIQITISHIIADRYSLDILFSYFHKAYFDNFDVHDEPVSCDLNHKNIDGDIIYWGGKLRGLYCQEYIPLDFDRKDVTEISGRYCYGNISRNVFKQITYYCRTVKITPYMFFLSVLFILQRRFSKSNDLLISTPISTRNSHEAGHFGPFFNTVLLRLEIDEEDISVTSVIAKVKKLFIDSCRHGNAILSDILEYNYIQDMMGQFSQITFVYQPKDFDSVANDSTVMKSFLVENNSTKCDITFYAIKDLDDNVNIKIEYAKEHFESDTIETLLDYFICLSEKISSNAYRSINENITTLDPYINTFSDSCSFDPDIFECYRKSVTQSPSHIAIYTKDRAYTYQMLDNEVIKIMKAFLTLEINSGDIICVYSERCIEVVALFIAFLRLNLIYLPIEPSLPIERVRYIISDSKPRLMISVSDFPNDNIDVKAIDYKKFIKSSSDLEDSLAVEQLSSRVNVINASCYVMYTSGTTGNPKGVVINKKALANRIFWMKKHLNIHKSDIVLHKTSLAFDVSVWELLLPFMVGASQVIADKKTSVDPDKLISIIEKHKVTTIHFVPVLFDSVLDYLDVVKNKLFSLKNIICSGDVLKKSTLLKANKYIPNGMVYNYYGPTEATIDVAYYQCSHNGLYKSIPIGKPIDNTKLYIFDKELLQSDKYVTGEIYIAGVSLADSYLNLPELTNRSFVWMRIHNKLVRCYKTGDLGYVRADGNIIFLGRVDRQIKIRGVRIERDEIENNLALHSNVISAYVTKLVINNVDILVSFVKIKKNSMLTVEDLHKHISLRLPAIMHPSEYIILNDFPTTQSGKIDAKILVNEYMSNVSKTTTKNEYVGSESLQYKIVQIWQNTFNLNNYNLSDDFYMLGGDSIKAIQFISRLKNLDLNITVSNLMELRTLRNIIEFLSYSTYNVAPSVNTYAPYSLAKNVDFDKDLISDLFPLSTLLRLLYVNSERMEEYSVYVTTFKIKSFLDLNVLENAVNHIVQKHEILRSYMNIYDYSRPMHLIAHFVEYQISYVDISLEKNRELIVKNHIDREKYMKFDWEQPKLFRFSVHKLDSEHFQFTISEPILDGWSVALVCSDIFKCYLSMLKNSGLLKHDYNGFLGFAASEEMKLLKSSEYKNYWIHKLNNCAETILIRSVHGKRKLSRRSYCFSSRGSNQLREFAKNYCVPLKTLLLSLHIKTLFSIIPQDKITTGLMSNLRPEILDADSVPGMFLNVLPVTITKEDISHSNFYQLVFDLETELSKFRHFPIACLIDANDAMLFDTVFNYTKFHLYSEFIDNEDFEIKHISGTDQTYYNITVQASEMVTTDIIRISIDFNLPVMSTSIDSDKLFSQYMTSFCDFSGIREVTTV